MTPEQKLLDLIGIGSAIGSCGFWLSTFLIRNDLENKIKRIELTLDARENEFHLKLDGREAEFKSKLDNLMVILSSRMQRQTDRNKVKIGELQTQLNHLSRKLKGEKACVDPDEIFAEIEDYLPDETTDFS